MPKNRFVEKLRGLSQLTDSEVSALEQLTSQFRVIGPRKDLIREGDKPGPMFVMLEGWACRYKMLPSGSRQIMAFLMPGDACDLHVSMLAEMDHSIQTLTPAQVAMVPPGVMEELMAGHPGIARAMYLGQLIDEGTLRSWIVSLGRRSSVERAAHLLLELHLRGARIGIADQDMIELPFSQAVIADALGMTGVHINRVLQELRRSNSIELRRGMLRILDPVRLTQIAGFDETYLHKRLPSMARPPIGARV